MSARLFTGLAGLAVFLGLLSALWIQHNMLTNTQQQLADTTEQLVKTRRANVELVRDADAASVRSSTVSAGREAVIAAPEGDNGGVGNILLKGLQTADRIGGLK